MNKKLFLLAIVLTLALVCLCGCDVTADGTYKVKDATLEGIAYTSAEYSFSDGKYVATFKDETQSVVKTGSYAQNGDTITLTGDLTESYKMEVKAVDGANKVYLTSATNELSRTDTATFGGSMKIMGFGMLAIFVVMIILFAVIKILNRVTNKKKA